MFPEKVSEFANGDVFIRNFGKKPCSRVALVLMEGMKNTRWVSLSSERYKTVAMGWLLLWLFLAAVVLCMVLFFRQSISAQHETSSMQWLEPSCRHGKLTSVTNELLSLYHSAERATVSLAKTMSASHFVETKECKWYTDVTVSLITWGAFLSMPPSPFLGVLQLHSDDGIGFLDLGSPPHFYSTPPFSSNGGTTRLSWVIHKTGDSSSLVVAIANETTGLAVDNMSSVSFSPPCDNESEVRKLIDHATRLPLGASAVDVIIGPFDVVGNSLVFTSPILHESSSTVDRVVVSMVSGSQLEAILRAGQGDHGGMMYIITSDGVLVATSFGAAVTGEPPPEGCPVLMHASQSENLLVRESAQALTSKYGSWDQLASEVFSHVHELRVEDWNYVMDTVSISLPDRKSEAQQEALASTRFIVVSLTPHYDPSTSWFQRSPGHNGRDEEGAGEDGGGGGGDTFSLSGTRQITDLLCVLLIGMVVVAVAWTRRVGIVSLMERRFSRTTRTLQRLTEKYHNAQQMVDTLGQYLSRTSHEIRTPLSGMIGTLSLTLDDPTLSRNVRDDVLSVKTCAETLLGLLNDILDVEKIAAGKMELEHGLFDIRACVEASVAIFASTSFMKGLELGLDYHATAARLLVGDSLRVGQIVRNLVSNAVKFTTTGYVTVRVWGQGVEGRGAVAAEGGGGGGEGSEGKGKRGRKGGGGGGW